MDRICENCRHYRTTEMVDGETGEIITIGYCHAIKTFPAKRPTASCKRFHYSERKVAEEVFL